MHLINTTTLELEYFIGGCHRPYAILSHTWDTDEVTFADFSGKQPRTYENKAGFDKIRRTCLQAKEDGLQYAWVDTCCINKDSSAELSEAINSMYRWYENSAVCYAFIADFREPHDLSQLHGCKWFSRGWTLQELLAPKHVVFYGHDWTLVGTKGTILETLRQITSIPADILSGTAALDTFSVAARMSWAARRETTRVEDMAYCLMGIFDVNMPLLYGEGSKAFLRLQSVIMNQTQDDSLFAWCADTDSAARFPYRGLFASSPREFADCSDIKHFGIDTNNSTPVSGSGRVSLKCGLETEGLRTLVAIKCYRQSIVNPLAIEVSRIGAKTYSRSSPSSLFLVPMRPFNQDIIFEKYAERPHPLANQDVHRHGSIYLKDIPSDLGFIKTIPSEMLINSSYRRISVIDALNARKVAFCLEVFGTGHEIFLIFWVDERDGDSEYRYLFDVVQKRKSTERQDHEDYRFPWISKTIFDLDRTAFERAGKPRELTDCQLVVGWVTVHVSPSWRVLDGHEVVVIQLSTTTDTKLEAEWRGEVTEDDKQLNVIQRQGKETRDILSATLKKMIEWDSSFW